MSADREVSGAAGLQPERLRSVYEMLKFWASEFIELGQVLGLIQMDVGNWTGGTPEETKAHETQLRADLQRLSEHCASLEMPVSVGLLKNAMADIPQTPREFDLLYSAIEMEQKSKFLLYVPADRAAFYENENLIPYDAWVSFPTACVELREGGTCYALGRYTAAALHAMRAAEVGVKALAKHLGYSPPDLDQMNWHPVLNKCESLIEDYRNKVPKGPNKEADLQFYSQAAVQFRYFNNGFRIQSAHVRRPFWEHEARETLLATISFYAVLSKHLSEFAP